MTAIPLESGWREWSADLGPQVRVEWKREPGLTVHHQPLIAVTPDG